MLKIVMTAAAASALLGAAALAAAEPLKLSNAQMDRVTAGATSSSSSSCTTSGCSTSVFTSGSGSFARACANGSCVLSRN